LEDNAATLPAVRPAVGAAVVVFALLSLVDIWIAFVQQSMPPSHFVAVPIALMLLTVIWFAELGGLRWPRLLFAVLVTAPNIWLAAIGHTSLNFLFLTLTVAWVSYTGDRRESLITLMLNLAVVVIAAVVNAMDGQLVIGAWIPWSVGLFLVWLIVRALVAQQRLAAELSAARDDLASQVTENQLLRAEAEQRLRDVEALYRADESLYGALRTDRVLDALIDIVITVLEAEKSAVLSAGAPGERLSAAASSGFDRGLLAGLSDAPAGGVLGRVIQSRTPAAIEDLARDGESDGVLRTLRGAGVQALLLVPIVVEDRTFGVLIAGYEHPKAFPAEEQRLFVALAQRAALALENARLYEQSQQTALLEERQRLARELHDAVTQTLFSSSLIAGALPRIWERDPAEGRRRLAELGELTRGALAEMRTLLYELRPAVLTETPLSDLLRQLADATIGRARLPVSLSVEGNSRPLPPDVQVAFYRIAQEALNNVAKHAGACSADFSLAYHEKDVELRVKDDGPGFDADRIPPGHLGVGIMHERAAAAGADITIESKAGQGTTISVVWPANGRKAGDV
jgi:two-component system nitrate/nitrite sensor histidine kinase NarX